MPPIKDYERPQDTLSQHLRSDFSTIRRRERHIPVAASRPSLTPAITIPADALRDDTGVLYRDEFGIYWVL